MALSAEACIDADVLEGVRNVVSRSIKGLNTVREAIKLGRLATAG